MATTPHPAPKPEPPKPPPPVAVKQDAPLPPGGYRPVIGVMGKPIDDGERDPDTVAEEQRRRSEEIEKVGVDAWVKAHDDRDRTPNDAEPKKVVPGITAAEKR